jgi:hypothetical protein
LWPASDVKTIGARSGERALLTTKKKTPGERRLEDRKDKSMKREEKNSYAKYQQSLAAETASELAGSQGAAEPPPAGWELKLGFRAATRPGNLWMRARRQNLVLAAAAASTLMVWAGTTSAQSLVYSEDFETDHSADSTWVINSVGGYNPVDLYFDYSTVGIAPAPHSAGGTTRGLKLQANLNPAVQQFPSGSSASPIAFSIPENFDLQWDWWINYNGPLNGGGPGSTQIGGGGFGTAATSAQAAGAHIDSIFVCASGESAGTAADYRVYSPAAQASWQDASGVYAAGTVGSRNNINPYYQATFPPVAAPAAQLTLYPQQTGTTQGGSAGMAWHEVSLKKLGSIVTYTIDGLLIAATDLTTNGILGGDHLVFGHFDINAGASTDPNAPALAFSLVDNVRVTEFRPVEITCPQDMAVPATTPDGASVDFSATTTEGCPPVSPVEYSPSPGSTFPIGSTTVTCTVTDACGHTASCSFNVRVKGAAEQIGDLTAVIQDLPIRPGIVKSLTAKMQAAGALVSLGNIQGACGALAAFIGEVSALRSSGQITPDQAALLIQEARRIGAVLGC